MIRINLVQFWLLVQFLILLHSSGSWSLTARFSQVFARHQEGMDFLSGWEYDVTSPPDKSFQSTSHIRGGRQILHSSTATSRGRLRILSYQSSAPSNAGEQPPTYWKVVVWCSLGGENYGELLSTYVIMWYHVCTERPQVQLVTVSHQLHLPNRSKSFFLWVRCGWSASGPVEHLQGDILWFSS